MAEGLDSIVFRERKMRDYRYGETISSFDQELSSVEKTDEGNRRKRQTDPFGLAKRFWLGRGLMVPVEDAEEAEEEESLSGSGRSAIISSLSSSSSSVDGTGSGGMAGNWASLALAKDLCRSLMERFGTSDEAAILRGRPQR